MQLRDELGTTNTLQMLLAMMMWRLRHVKVALLLLGRLLIVKILLMLKRLTHKSWLRSKILHWWRWAKHSLEWYTLSLHLCFVANCTWGPVDKSLLMHLWSQWVLLKGIHIVKLMSGHHYIFLNRGFLSWKIEWLKGILLLLHLTQLVILNLLLLVKRDIVVCSHIKVIKDSFIQIFQALSRWFINIFKQTRFLEYIGYIFSESDSCSRILSKSIVTSNDMFE